MNHDSTREEMLDKVRGELARYEHPLFEWSAVSAREGVEVSITLKAPVASIDPYVFHLSSRDVNARSFEWDFQRLLYNYLHDYLVDTFTRSPHIRD